MGHELEIQQLEFYNLAPHTPYTSLVIGVKSEFLLMVATCPRVVTKI